MTHATNPVLLAGRRRPVFFRDFGEEKGLRAECGDEKAAYIKHMPYRLIPPRPPHRANVPGASSSPSLAVPQSMPASPSWQPVTSPVTLSNGHHRLTGPMTGPQRFFQLQWP